MADEYDESMFYVCVDGVLRHVSCPEGLIFDPALESCVKGTTTPTTTSSTTTSTTTTTTTTTTTPAPNLVINVNIPLKLS